MADQVPSGKLMVKFWGTRGSIPTPGEGFYRFGGNTSCVEVKLGDRDRIVFDAGSGIRLLGEEILQNKTKPVRLAIFFSHFHWDHIQGLPFFQPFFVHDAQIEMWGADSAGMSLEQILDHQMHTAFHPVSRSSLTAQMKFHKLSLEPVEIFGAKVSMCKVRHPGFVLAFRIDWMGKSIVYATDREPDPEDCPEDEQTQECFESMVKGADILIHDAQYTDEEYFSSKIGWGHSPVSEAIRVARDAKVKKLFFFHHDPEHDDAMLSRFEEEIQAKVLLAENLEAGFAREGMTITA